MPEVARATDMSDEQFVASLYRNLLQRQPQSHEVEHWKGMLAGGTARADVVEVFMSSSEYLNLQQQKERFQVASNLPADASEQEQYILSAMQTHVVRSQQGVQAERSRKPSNLPQPKPNFENLTKRSSDVWKAQESVGQLNPRNAGPINGLVQGSKKFLQRSLSWYTRSLQAFNLQVATAIEEQGNAIHSIDRSSQQLREEVRRLEGELLKLQSDRFQNTVRAMEYATQEHLSPYVEFFRNASAVVDLGCGRGEFLELLKDAGITAYGVDSDEEACAAALRKGLKVFDEDVFEHLAELPERSLGGVFSARLIEFLPPNQLAKLVELCSSRIKPGGVLVLETTNPDSKHGYGRVTNLDRTHLRMISPELMVSILQSNSFGEVKVLASGPIEIKTNESLTPPSGNGFTPASHGKHALTGPTYAVAGWRN
jgi:SAM-dependent methyltransferase